MNGIEMIELCAKALGWTVEENGNDVNGHPWFWVPQIADNWHPVHNQADSDNMACDLGIFTLWGSSSNAYCYVGSYGFSVEHDNTIEGRRAAVRLARAQVAAEMGRAIK